MFPVTLKFVKTHPNAVLPKYNHADPYTGDTGLDLTAVERAVIPAHSSCVVPVGLKLGHITPGYWFRIEARSGLGFKKSVFPHFGIIDNGYTGDLGTKLYNNSNVEVTIEVGDRIAQITVYPLIQANVEWTEKAQDSKREEKGFGSSDEKLQKIVTDFTDQKIVAELVNVKV